MEPIFTCVLNVPAWTGEVMRAGRQGYRPSLTVLRADPGMSPEVLAEVTIFMDANPGRDRWAARFFPAEIRGIEPGRDEGRGYHRTTVDILAPGEVRVPRETPHAALRVVIERLAGEVPRAELVAVEKVAMMLLDMLAKAGAAYCRQFRPAV